MQPYTSPRIQDYNGELSQRWYVYYHFPDPDTGKMQRWRIWISEKYKTKTTRYAAAKQLRDDLEKKLIQGFTPYTPKTARQSIRNALNIALAVRAKTLRIRTLHSYNSVADLFCTWLDKHNLGHLMPHQLSKTICRNYFDDCLMIDKISPRTYNNRLRTLRTLFNELCTRDYVEFNVFTKIKLLSQTEATLQAFTASEKILIKETLAESKKELWLCALFVYYGFVRPQELCRIKIGQIDFNFHLLHIQGDQSKNKRAATVILPEPLMRVLIQMRYNELNKDLFIFSNGRHLTPGTKEISPNRIFNEWQQFVKKPLGINKGIYLFKHTGAGELFEGNADPRNIQLQLRHKSLEQTVIYLEKYSKKPNESLRKHFKEI